MNFTLRALAEDAKAFSLWRVSPPLAIASCSRLLPRTTRGIITTLRASLTRLRVFARKKGERNQQREREREGRLEAVLTHRTRLSRVSRASKIEAVKTRRHSFALALLYIFFFSLSLSLFFSSYTTRFPMSLRVGGPLEEGTSRIRARTLSRSRCTCVRTLEWRSEANKRTKKTAK